LRLALDNFKEQDMKLGMDHIGQITGEKLEFLQQMGV
jgi:hypothetical protein